MTDEEMIKYLQKHGYNIEKLPNINYSVEVKFAGMIGASEFINIEAPINADEDTIMEILRTEHEFELLDMLEVVEINDLGDGDYEVTFNFNGYIGCDETYTVYADDEDDAEEQARDEAIWDFSIESFTPEE